VSFDRYTFVRLAPAHATDDGRAEALAAIHARLAALPGLRRLTAGTPADDSAARWDLVVVARFATLGELHAALAAPVWTELFDGWLVERAVVVKSWSFEVADAPLQ
jgi:hypothetical protein